MAEEGSRASVFESVSGAAAEIEPSSEKRERADTRVPETLPA